MRVNRSKLFRVGGGVALLILLASGCAPRGRPAGETWLAMGTFASVTVASDDREDLPRYVAAARETFSDLENKLSGFDPQSDISRLNQSVGGVVDVSPPTWEVLFLSLKYAELSGGAFDVTVAPLVDLWGFHGGRIPDEPLSADAVAAVRRKVGYRHLAVLPCGAMLDEPGMKVDLGGIAKGYAVDVCYARLVAMGATNLMVNLGGNLRCGGSPRRGGTWRIGVRNPFDTELPVGTLALTGGLAVATSGNYERFVTIAGRRYAHIIDPVSGYPVEGMAGVTVVAPTAAEADALSTSLFVLGIERSKPVLADLPLCQALFVPDRQPLEIWITPGMRRIYTPEAGFDKPVRIVR